MRRIRATLKGIAHEIIHKTISGFGNVTLEYPINDGLEAVTLYGGTEQDDTDVLQSVVLDGATVQRNVPEGYTELDYLRNVSNATKFDTGLKPLVGDELEIVRTAGTTSQSNYLLQSRVATNAGIWGISGSQAGGTIIASWGNGQSIVSNITRTEGHKYYTKMSVTATTLTLTVKDLTDNSSNTKNSSITAEDGVSNYFIRGNGVQFLTPPQKVYYARISNNGVDRIRLIPAKQGDIVGFYDMVSNTFMSTFVGDTPTPSTEEATPSPFVPMDIVCNNGAIRFSSGTIYTEGDVETIQDSSGNTATAEMLLKLGDLVDTQEVLSGNITRKIGIKVFDGTETLEESVSVGGRHRYTLSVTGIFTGVSTAYSTHFVGGKTLPELNSDTTITEAVSVHLAKIRFYTTTYETLSDFTSFLASQYANGTPVIVIYPLATATTSSVEGQELITKPITQTAGSISNMTITVTSDGGIPNPTTPKDIICNNGELKVSRNLFDMSKAIRGDIASIDGSINTTISYRLASDFIPVLAGQSYTASGKICFEELSDEYNIRLITAFYDSNKGFITGSRIVRQGEFTFEIPTGTYYVRVEYWGDPAVGNTVDTTRSKLQFEIGTTATNYMPYGLYTDGTTETITDNLGNTATAEMLLKIGVGEYEDEQEILSGSITRNVATLVLDGTENWIVNTQSTYPFFRLNNALMYSGNLASGFYCTHFPTAIISGNSNEQGIRIYNNSIFLRWDDLYTASSANVTNFKTWIATQYANGTPVILVYPLDNATTETVAGQTLTSVISNTNTIEITQAGMNPTDLQLEVDYLGYDM